MKMRVNVYVLFASEPGHNRALLLSCPLSPTKHGIFNFLVLFLLPLRLPRGRARDGVRAGRRRRGRDDVGEEEDGARQAVRQVPAHPLGHGGGGDRLRPAVGAARAVVE